MKKVTALSAALLLGASSLFAASPASFPGGDAAEKEYFATNLKYPEAAKANDIEGVVVVVFTVKADGSIGNIKIKRMVDPDLEAEAIRLVKSMPAWTPAKNDAGTPVESTAEASVNFTLSE